MKDATEKDLLRRIKVLENKFEKNEQKALKWEHYHANVLKMLIEHFALSTKLMQCIEAIGQDLH
jgi:hypothetical protein